MFSGTAQYTYSVYSLTSGLTPNICIKMSLGRLESFILCELNSQSRVDLRSVGSSQALTWNKNLHHPGFCCESPPKTLAVSKNWSTRGSCYGPFLYIALWHLLNQGTVKALCKLRTFKWLLQCVYIFIFSLKCHVRPRLTGQWASSISWPQQTVWRWYYSTGWKIVLWRWRAFCLFPVK